MNYKVFVDGVEVFVDGVPREYTKVLSGYYVNEIRIGGKCIFKDGTPWDTTSNTALDKNKLKRVVWTPNGDVEQKENFQRYSFNTAWFFVVRYLLLETTYQQKLLAFKHGEENVALAGAPSNCKPNTLYKVEDASGNGVFYVRMYWNSYVVKNGLYEMLQGIEMQEDVRIDLISRDKISKNSANSPSLSGQDNSDAQKQISSPKKGKQTESYALNTILYGPPGTGKTYNTVTRAVEIIESKEYADYGQAKEFFAKLLSAGRLAFTTFHQSYSYEEFIEGIKPVLDNAGKQASNPSQASDVKYGVKDGVFKAFCREAEQHPSDNYVFIIDEINRGNISKIFGELITLVEDTKRAGHPDALEVTLPYSGEKFSIPKNVYILGTMNTADRSLALMDTALRRRFRFEEMMPQPDLLQGIKILDQDGNDTRINLVDMLTALNQRIEYLYDREHTLGHAYFLKLKDNATLACLADIFRNDIIPLLQEYFYDDYRKIRWVLADNQKKKNYQFVQLQSCPDNLFGKNEDAPKTNDLNDSYVINAVAFDNPSAYLGIYPESRNQSDNPELSEHVVTPDEEEQAGDVTVAPTVDIGDGASSAVSEDEAEQ